MKWKRSASPKRRSAFAVPAITADSPAVYAQKKDDIKELAVGADVRSDDALSIRGRNVEGSKSDVIEWIDQLNY